LFYDFHKFFNSKQTKKVYIKKKKIAKNAQKKVIRKNPCVCEWKNRLQLRFPSRWVCVCACVWLFSLGTGRK